MAKYKLLIDKKTCIGCGACTNQSDNWELVEEADGYKARPKKSEVTEIGDNKAAEEVCPVNAIKIVKI